MSQERKRLLEILDYWHKIEFFAPFGLDQRIDELESWRTRTLFHQFLHYCDDDSWRIIDWPPDREILGYELYLVIFDKSAITQVCRQYLPEPSAKSVPTRTYEESERADLEGTTCFAKIRLNRQGIPLLDSISVSTLPWALSQLRTHGLKAFEQDAFKKEREKIKELVNGFLAERRHHTNQALAANEVIRLHQLLCQWAEFTPDLSQPVAILEAIVRDKSISSKSPAAVTPDHTHQSPLAEVFANPEEERKLEINLLNSIFLHEIERATVSVRGDKTPKALRQYLTPLNTNQRIPLFESPGHEAIHGLLHPKHFGLGRWLTSPTQAMSLTQQFSINAIGKELQNGGLFSVTGWPGTGKIALLREICADNMVRRARALAGLAHATDAFVTEGQIDIVFQGKPRKHRISPLIPALTGFEMVVISPDTASMEAVSDCLNQRAKVDGRWEDVNYLRPATPNASVRITNDAGLSSQSKQMPWGWISYALEQPRLGYQTCEYLASDTAGTQSGERSFTLRDWLKQDQAQTFAQASQEFQQTDKAVQEALAKRGRLADLIELFRTTTEPQFLQQQQHAVEQARKQLADAEAAIEATQNELNENENKLKRLRSAEHSIEQNRPFWLFRLLKTRAAELYFSEKIANANRQVETRHQGDALRKTLAGPLKENQKTAAAQLRIREHELQNRQTLWRNQLEECQTLRQTLGMPRLPEDLVQLENDEFQMQGVWHDETIAALRSDLFAKALAVQQAWLAEVGQSGGGFDTTIDVIANMLSGRKIVDPAHYLPVWQSLFMIIPVITTNFASFTALFKELEVESLGWLFIDDAERFMPQAAVGALWRAKRAVTFGDTQQIEPAYFTPNALIDALGKQSPHTTEGSYAPSHVSVQRLADRANRYGVLSHTGESSNWIGSPLRVHRRCIEPMFGLSNSIAYEGRMLFGGTQRSAPEGPPVPIPSCWVDIRGATTHEHSVYAQTRFMLEIIIRLYRKNGKLPDIYMLSPFKAIIRSLQKAMRKVSRDIENASQTPVYDQFNAWLRTHTGTAHTFPGEAQDTIFMLLGSDREHPESAQWVAAKPNFLNIALTRAKRRFYLVGDYELWSPLPFFNTSIQGEYAMPRIEMERFILNIGH
ncbi:MAG: hypothetical protein LBV45_05145 [Xanthomonadaceae bacterium]|jgi:hypothetical protein|nr:hypothetical protein [Xanthomonadaceae bacterium]